LSDILLKKPPFEKGGEQKLSFLPCQVTTVDSAARRVKVQQPLSFSVQAKPAFPGTKNRMIPLNTKL
jgi:hypothetical protein